MSWMNILDAAIFDLGHPVTQYYAVAAVMAYPVARIFARAGLRPVSALWLLAPLLGLVICAGILALRRWPVLPPRDAVKKGDA